MMIKRLRLEVRKVFAHTHTAVVYDEHTVMDGKGETGKQLNREIYFSGNVWTTHSFYLCHTHTHTGLRAPILLFKCTVREWLWFDCWTSTPLLKIENWWLNRASLNGKLLLSALPTQQHYYLFCSRTIFLGFLNVFAERSRTILRNDCVGVCVCTVRLILFEEINSYANYSEDKSFSIRHPLSALGKMDVTGSTDFVLF